MSKHTPGPWKWNKNYHGLDGPRGEAILDYAAYEGMWVPDYAGDWAEANARLIAAAPELLEALQMLLVACDTSDDCQYGTLGTSFVRNIASAAIAKAEGHE
jgi:hypothetical protein